MTIKTVKSIPGFANEAGGHRIQRIPSNERKGRVHTSTVCVSVLNDTQQAGGTLYDKRTKDDFAYRWFSGTGKGGQHRNRHANCLELTHIPSGLSVKAQGRLRPSNEREAMDSLLVKLDQRRDSEDHAATNQIRSAQVGSGMRGDKVRTYRFRDDSITDHVSGKSTTCISFMKGNITALWVG